MAKKSFWSWVGLLATLGLAAGCQELWNGPSAFGPMPPSNNGGPPPPPGGGAPPPGGGKSVPNSTKCPAPGETVPLQKALEFTFLSDYQGCDVTIEAEFHVKHAAQSVGNAITFMMMPFGAHENTAPNTMGNFAVPKEIVDPMLTAKIGDKFLMRGKVYGRSHDVVLMVTTIKKP